MRVPARQDSPVLTSVQPVIEASKHVRTDEARLVDVASWLAYEELPMPQFLLPFRPAGDRGDVIDFILLCASIDFAFTDFTTRTKFEVEHDGQLWSDSDALFACVGRALAAGDDLGDGRRLSTITAQELDVIFAGNITMPMLEERATHPARHRDDPGRPLRRTVPHRGRELLAAAVRRGTGPHRPPGRRLPAVP